MISQNSIEQIKQTTQTFEVVDSLLKLKQVGPNWVASCPFHEEKSPSFKVSKAKNIYKCFGCGASGDAIEFLMKFKKITYLDAVKWLAEFYHIAIEEERQEEAKVYAKPALAPGQLSSKWLQWFSERKISGITLDYFKVTMTTQWMPKAKKTVDAICFNYFKNGELVNVKYRADDKDFMLAKDAELVFYNIDSIGSKDIAVIVEGEIDALSVYESGATNIAILSVPNGAAKGVQKLEYLNTCFDAFKRVKNIVLMTDNDEPGILLRQELSRRFGLDKCLLVEYPDGCKDANDILVKFGKDRVLEVIADAKEIPLEGILQMSDLVDDVRRYYKEGYPHGFKAGIAGFDDHMQFMLGQYTTGTGIPGSGKSEFTDLIMTSLARNHGWSWGACSFENQPTALHATKIMEKYIGKSFMDRENPNHRISQSELEEAIQFVDNFFYFVNVSKITATLAGILDKAKELILRYGIKGLLIDPWNYIEHKYSAGQNETTYISDCLTQIKVFAAIYQIHIILIAHPTKQAKINGKYEIPNLYSISGSAHFFNKTDNGFTVHRNYDNNTVDIHIQKIRFSWLGKIGVVSYIYNSYTRQYELIIYPKEEKPESPQKPYSGLNHRQLPTEKEEGPF